MNAEEIKKAIIEKHTKPKKPTQTAEIFGIEGWLFKPTSAQMEGWRSMVNAITQDGKPDDNIRKLAPAKLIQISFRDKEGKPVFEELDLPMIGGMPDDQVNPLRLTILRINGMNTEGFEDVLKNLIAIIGIDGVYAMLVKIGAPCPNCRKDIPSTNSESNISVSNTGPPATQPKATKPSSPDRSQAKK